MRANRMKTVILALAAFGLVAVTTRAAVTLRWDACDSGVTDCLFNFCWCEGRWSTSADWSGPGIPDGTTEKALFRQTNEGDPTCPLNGTAETWLQVNMSTKTFGALEIKADTGGQMRMIFWGPGTLTADATVLIDGVRRHSGRDRQRWNTQNAVVNVLSVGGRPVGRRRIRDLARPAPVHVTRPKPNGR